MASGRVFLWAALGAVTVGSSKGCEAMGDAASAAGQPGSALAWHLAALAMLIAAMASGWKFFRAISQADRGADAGHPERTARMVEDRPGADADFDPDAVIASYLARRANKPAAPVRPVRPGGQGFGKRGL